MANKPTKGGTFNLKDLATAISEKFELKRQLSTEITYFMLEQIKIHLVGGKQVRLHNFGTFEARPRAAGLARNPITGESIFVAERRIIKLTSVSPQFKAMLGSK